MTKADFLHNNPETLSFVTWLADITTGKRALNFKHQQGADQALDDALSRYLWPNKRIDISTPDGIQTILGRSDFAANATVLNQLSAGIQTALTRSPPCNTELAGWAKAIMQWGGVFTTLGKNRTGGNAPWLAGIQPGFHAYLQQVLPALQKHDDIDLHLIANLRSNAGTTKIHSLILPDFVIYDSRVAAALAWLVRTWAEENSTVVPLHLRFACMRANTQKAGGKRRSPDEKIFPYFVASGHVRNHRKHALWNRRANWVIAAAAEQVALVTDEATRRWTSREMEAAMFMMGDDLSLAV